MKTIGLLGGNHQRNSKKEVGQFAFRPVPDVFRGFCRN